MVIDWNHRARMKVREHALCTTIYLNDGLKMKQGRGCKNGLSSTTDQLQNRPRTWSNHHQIQQKSTWNWRERRELQLTKRDLKEKRSRTMSKMELNRGGCCWFLRQKMKVFSLTLHLSLAPSLSLRWIKWIKGSKKGVFIAKGTEKARW